MERGDCAVNRIPCSSLDYYNKSVIRMIMEKYGMNQMDAARAFLNSRTHEMLEDPEMAMWEFSDRAVFDIWEAERVTGDPRRSVHLRSELS